MMIKKFRIFTGMSGHPEWRGSVEEHRPQFRRHLGDSLETVGRQTAEGTR